MLRPTTIKDKSCLEYIDHLEKRLELYEKSPYASTYLTILNQVNDFNEQLTIKAPKKITTTEGQTVTITEGRVDIFGSNQEKEFDRAWKYMMDAGELLNQLEKLRTKMTVDEKKDADSSVKLREGSTAEKYIFNK